MNTLKKFQYDKESTKIISWGRKQENENGIHLHFLVNGKLIIKMNFAQIARTKNSEEDCVNSS